MNLFSSPEKTLLVDSTPSLRQFPASVKPCHSSTSNVRGIKRSLFGAESSSSKRTAVISSPQQKGGSHSFSQLKRYASDPVSSQTVFEKKARQTPTLLQRHSSEVS